MLEYKPTAFYQDTGGTLFVQDACGESGVLVSRTASRSEGTVEVVFQNPVDTTFDGLLRLDGPVQTGRFMLDIAIE